MSSVSRFLNLAGEDLETAQLLLANQRYRACVSRAYYAMYYATQALLMQRNLISRSHKGMIQQFSQHFIKSGELPQKMAKDLRQAYDFRQLSDYEEVAEINQEQATKILASSVEFVAQVSSFLEGVKRDF